MHGSSWEVSSLVVLRQMERINVFLWIFIGPEFFVSMSRYLLDAACGKCEPASQQTNENL